MPGDQGQGRMGKLLTGQEIRIDHKKMIKENFLPGNCRFQASGCPDYFIHSRIMGYTIDLLYIYTLTREI